MSVVMVLWRVEKEVSRLWKWLCGKVLGCTCSHFWLFIVVGGAREGSSRRRGKSAWVAYRLQYRIWLM